MQAGVTGMQAVQRTADEKKAFRKQNRQGMNAVKISISHR